MSKSITIPTNRGSRITVVINEEEYVYAAGETVTVPNEVAALIEDAIANEPSGTRVSADDALLAGVEAEIAAVEEEIDALDERVTALEDAGDDTDSEGD